MFCVLKVIERLVDGTSTPLISTRQNYLLQ